MKPGILGLLVLALIGVSSVASADRGANTGGLKFDSAGNLTQAVFGTNCDVGCFFTNPSLESWTVATFPLNPNAPSFFYAPPCPPPNFCEIGSGTASLSLVSQSNSQRTYDFTVTADTGPLSGDVATGSFTFNSNIIPAGGGRVDKFGLLTDLLFTWNGISYNASAIPIDGGGPGVPEPATFSLLALGLASVGFMRRRKKRTLP